MPDAPRNLVLRNRQRVRRVDTRRLRRLARRLLEELLHRQTYDLGIFLVAAPEMARVNETFLGHAGSTDVITFDYNDSARPEVLAGELFICLDDAVTQAREFHTTWQSELARYVVHGVLHLSGYDDLTAPERRRMKREEDRLVSSLAERGNPLRLLAGALR